MADSPAGSAMDPEERELLAQTLRKTMTTTASGRALDEALSGLGWREMLAEMPEVAIPLVFRLLGETGAHAPVLNDVIGAARADHLADAGTALVLPYAGGSWVVWDRADEATSALELPLRRVAPAAAPLAPQALAAGRVAAGWWLLGSGRAMLALARQHAVDRVQFGRPIASFQAVRHKLADTLVALDGAQAVLNAAPVPAAGACDDLSAVLRTALLTKALLAKAAAGHAALLAARHCQQVLGGIGFTAEHALHHHVKRVLVLDGLLGSTRELTREAGRRVIADGSASRLVDL
jgi:hypothetical protein